MTHPADDHLRQRTQNETRCPETRRDDVSITIDSDAMQRWRKRIQTLESAAVNAERMCELLQPEFDAFEARTGHNVYVVRDYVDHMNAARKHRQEIADIHALLGDTP